MKFNYLLKDSSGKRSVTHTAFVLGFIIVNLKLLTSGLALGTVKVESFDGTQYGIALAALGAIYILRRNTDKGDKDNVE